MVSNYFLNFAPEKIARIELPFKNKVERALTFLKVEKPYLSFV